MKKMMILAVMMVMTISARSAMPLGSSKNAMSYNAATHNDRHGSDRHMAMNTSRGNGGHFGRR